MTTIWLICECLLFGIFFTALQCKHLYETSSEFEFRKDWLGAWFWIVWSSSWVWSLGWKTRRRLFPSTFEWNHPWASTQTLPMWKRVWALVMCASFGLRIWGAILFWCSAVAHLGFPFQPHSTSLQVVTFFTASFILAVCLLSLPLFTTMLSSPTWAFCRRLFLILQMIALILLAHGLWWQQNQVQVDESAMFVGAVTLSVLRLVYVFVSWIVTSRPLVYWLISAALVLLTFIFSMIVTFAISIDDWIPSSSSGSLCLRVLNHYHERTIDQWLHCSKYTTDSSSSLVEYWENQDFVFLSLNTDCCWRVEYVLDDIRFFLLSICLTLLATDIAVYFSFWKARTEVEDDDDDDELDTLEEKKKQEKKRRPRCRQVRTAAVLVFGALAIWGLVVALTKEMTPSIQTQETQPPPQWLNLQPVLYLNASMSTTGLWSDCISLDTFQQQLNLTSQVEIVQTIPNVFQDQWICPPCHDDWSLERRVQVFVQYNKTGEVQFGNTTLVFHLRQAARLEIPKTIPYAHLTLDNEFCQQVGHRWICQDSCSFPVEWPAIPALGSQYISIPESGSLRRLFCGSARVLSLCPMGSTQLEQIEFLECCAMQYLGQPSVWSFPPTTCTWKSLFWLDDQVHSDVLDTYSCSDHGVAPSSSSSGFLESSSSSEFQLSSSEILKSSSSEILKSSSSEILESSSSEFLDSSSSGISSSEFLESSSSEILKSSSSEILKSSSSEILESSSSSSEILKSSSSEILESSSSSSEILDSSSSSSEILESSSSSSEFLDSSSSGISSSEFLESSSSEILKSSSSSSEILKSSSSEILESSSSEFLESSSSRISSSEILESSSSSSAQSSSSTFENQTVSIYLWSIGNIHAYAVPEEPSLFWIQRALSILTFFGSLSSWQILPSLESSNVPSATTVSAYPIWNLVFVPQNPLVRDFLPIPITIVSQTNSLAKMSMARWSGYVYPKTLHVAHVPQPIPKPVATNTGMIHAFVTFSWIVLPEVDWSLSIFVVDSKRSKKASCMYTWSLANVWNLTPNTSFVWNTDDSTTTCTILPTLATLKVVQVQGSQLDDCSSSFPMAVFEIQMGPLPTLDFYTMLTQTVRLVHYKQRKEWFVEPRARCPVSALSVGSTQPDDSRGPVPLYWRITNPYVRSYLRTDVSETILSSSVYTPPSYQSIWSIPKHWFSMNEQERAEISHTSSTTAFCWSMNSYSYADWGQEFQGSKNVLTSSLKCS